MVGNNNPLPTLPDNFFGYSLSQSIKFKQFLRYDMR